MRVFRCSNCGQIVFFANNECLRCHSPLGYVHEKREVVALTWIDEQRMVDLAPSSRVWRYCAMNTLTWCNWLVPDGGVALCESCALTRIRPADEDTEGLRELVRAEGAKRRLVFQLAEVGLPIQPRDEGRGEGLAFDLLSSSAIKVVTGHDMGVITLDLAEADDEHRERLRQQLSEPYRTVLGHFRHEIGHYYWPILVHEPAVLEACRTIFGDDEIDYGDALERHYASDEDSGAWVNNFVSRYATMHPYEDWAESFAHYLHILDTMQTAASFGLLGQPPIETRGRRPGDSARTSATRPDGSGSFGELINDWLQLSYGLNQINQSMGQEDLYPFVLAPGVIRKLAFVDRVVRNVVGEAA